MHMSSNSNNTHHGGILDGRLVSVARTHVPPRISRKSSAKERQRAERDQLIKSLKESPGKRDARNFLKHFDTPHTAAPRPATPVERAVSDVVKRAHHNEWRLTQTGVNLGNLYEPTKAVQDSPVFAQQPLPAKPKQHRENVEPLHLALVKLRQPQALGDKTLEGIALTLSQMARLGLNIAVVVDCDEDMASHSLELSPAWEAAVREQAARIVGALEEYNEPGAFEVDHALYHSKVDTDIPSTVQARCGVEVKNNHLLFLPIEDGIIPVIPPFAYDAELKKVRVHADDVVLALTREFAGISSQVFGENVPLGDATYDNTVPLTNKPILDRIIILDPLGGIPSDNRADGAHVFINLEAEYDDVKNGLPDRHTRNVDVVQRSLKLLPPSSSALIITPAEAAISSQVPFLPAPSTGVRTRRSKNPLIHNLLTDKPMISSSLPGPLVNRPNASASPNPATFLKKGIPVTMIPDPRISGPWQPPSPSAPSIDLANDPRINFPRLVDLIDDSFRRKLDARHYLERIRGRVAGIIIAGDYEGGAICTWETPPNLRPISPDSPLWIPYLDKFAVLTKSQGSGGVADIVWGALTRSCFPTGLVWRSRTSNPVNKWYFERSVGMWNLPGDQWTMFWTTEGVVEEHAKQKQGTEISGKGDGSAEEEMTRWDAYVSVCRGVVPSWADGKKPD
ncbi:N-acetylglutamate synthase [Melanomma pulvis-pyrius CBS 109.77]|uniref:Amino-acid acetyltransferase, mitochondrial n=1 Tax=Melanomma pulvis-pyrius CBS 109.77 TaxID=1314802 RepID=A0A6A6XLQ8_9PLEO|nr:N-acetylglutamate synthase [Melanomma pulvis-pyrius CBS 109.77]